MRVPLPPIKESATAAKMQAYLANLPTSLRARLLELHDLIREAAPEAAESFGYGMPAFKMNGKDFVWYGAWKSHISLYPLSEATRRSFAKEVAGYDTSGKGTIRFPSGADLPKSLVIGLVKARIAEVRRKSAK